VRQGEVGEAAQVDSCCRRAMRLSSPCRQDILHACYFFRDESAFFLPLWCGGVARRRRSPQSSPSHGVP